MRDLKTKLYEKLLKNLGMFPLKKRRLRGAQSTIEKHPKGCHVEEGWACSLLKLRLQESLCQLESCTNNSLLYVFATIWWVLRGLKPDRETLMFCDLGSQLGKVVIKLRTW